ncbi:aminoacyl-tRNA hydrolase [Fimbriiglobus ruber]|uniref:Peptidyl-tRNA hydrolase n=1 Tax=Fimbriiglobus ruber TaxID=1908690 RepID=A0A225DWR8_9BACT|nr:aminoacyl-tRNA hydrolase [Fimbriiglobus ruber]OWK40765.1 Peptidyl-tRNA hydrolase [Fimbriiglobus ruber]
MKVIVGLGNPGPKYAGTRHNVGFDVVDYLAAAPGCGPFRAKFQAQIAELKEGNEQVLLVKPETFMNLSGRAVRQVVDFYKLATADLLVISDDFNLPLGKLRVRSKGSHGGQNGLRNIQEQLGTDEYPRLRIGVGQPGPNEAVDFVLSRFKPGERSAVEDTVAKAAGVALLWVRAGIEVSMNKANGPEPDAKPKAPKKDGEGRDQATDAEKRRKKKDEKTPDTTGSDGPKAS